MGIKVTETTKKLLKLKQRLRCVCGGTSASKTMSILMILIDYAQSNKNKKIDIMSESYPHLEDGVIKDFKTIMIDREYWKDRRWNETKHYYIFETGTIIKFLSIDKLGKAHGPRRDVLFLNEANNINYNIYDQLEVRTKEIIWLDWNPVSEFWYYTEIKGKVPHDFLTVTYLDCLNALDDRIIKSIERRKNRKNWWRVYGQGLLGEIENKIYSGWEIVDEVPHHARLERYGLDFGYTNDPTAIVAVHYYDGGYILDEIAFRTGMKNKVIGELILDQERSALVIADSAEPKSIDEIKEMGIDICGVSKKRGESKDKSFVKWKIDLVQEQRISVTKRSLNIIKEYRNYLWSVDKDGNTINVPEHEFSHSMNAIEYAFVSILKSPVIKEYKASPAVLPFYGDQDLSF